MLVNVKLVECFEGPAYNYVGEDGYPTSALIPTMLLTATDGKIYQFPNEVVVEYTDEGEGPYVNFKYSLQVLDKMVAEIKSQGKVDAKYWHEVTMADMKEYLCGRYGPAE